MAGLIGYGTYIPLYRLTVDAIATFWQKNAGEIGQSLGLQEKSCPAIDEDSATLAVEATLDALTAAGIKPEQIDLIAVGSESHPYAVKPTATTVADIIGMPPNYLALDTEFACKAATAALELAFGSIAAGKTTTGLVIGTDTAQAKPGDALDYSAASAAVALLVGDRDVIATVSDYTSYTSGTPDFWRRDGQKYPAHAGRFTGEPAYFAHVLGASKALLGKVGAKPQDFDYVVFHMPNGKFPQEAAKRLGFTKEQIMPGFTVSQVGNPYSASALLGLAAVLDQAKPGQKIFLCSYGSGAGSDAFIFETTKALPAFQKKRHQTVAEQLAKKQYISYPTYLRFLQTRETDQA